MRRVEEVVAALRARGSRLTPQREAIIREVMGARGHITPQDIAHRVRRRMPAVNASTVYRTLATLEELGVLDATQTGTWGGVQRLPIMGAQAKNRITFESAFNPPGTDPWGVHVLGTAALGPV